ncbi:nitroreductase family protein [Paenibacillus sp. N1-5-1-14]|uniref:nitroreductase family protein n=1 Tax=Paenibacillus radicibacter TaxID=2972488 RepID=UPI002158EE46|nr:nitroreductase family protein [Paenibacillus radicibacter]MCR8642840.1 nitroreductase family protein [Paenibacillus radicibacter]
MSLSEKIQPIDRSVIMDMLNIAVWAPNHKLREPWRFVYADGAGKQRLVDVVSKYDNQLALAIEEAPVCLIVTAKTNKDMAIEFDDFGAVSCLIQNLQLMTQASGLGMKWDLADYSEWTELLKLASIEGNERIAGILTIGYADERQEKSADRKIASQIAVW